jgi:hypothetical protein
MIHYTKQTASLDHHSITLEDGYIEFLFWTVDYWDWDCNFKLGKDWGWVELPFITIGWDARKWN